MTYTRVLLVLITAILYAVEAQINSIPGGGGQSQYYLDAQQDCDGTPREVGGATSVIYGKSTTTQSNPVQSCSLTLNTTNIREPHRFKLEFPAISITDPDVHFYIYDGEYSGRLMYALSNMNGLPPNAAFEFTSGQQVTFRLTRGQQASNYNIIVTATPVPCVILC